MGPLPIVFLLISGGTGTPPPTPTAPLSGTLTPLTGSDRLKWVVKKTIGPSSLFVGAVQASWSQSHNHPEEYGQGAEGLGKRFALRLSSVGTSNVMEAGLGAIWHEDPRYFRAHEESNGGRFRHAVKMTVMAHRDDGTLAPAYARYIAYAGSNTISDSWRPDSQRTVLGTIGRIGYRFAGRLVGNLWIEFWPTMKEHMFWNHH